MAAAGACGYETEEYRPILGIVFLGEKIDFSKTNSIEYAVNILIHELTHTLVFTTNMYKLYKAQPVTKEIMWQGQKKAFMVTPKVVEASRKHYGCNSLVGVQLEDQGQETSALTHWESRIILETI